MRPSMGEYAIRHRTAGGQRRRLARARTVQVPRVPPADRGGVPVDLRRGHVGRRDGASGHRTVQRPDVAVAGRDLPRRRPGRVRVGRRARRRPDQPAHHHHRRRDRQRDRRVRDRGPGTRWRPADLAHGGRQPRRWASRRLSSSPPTARSCRGSCLPNSCWPPTASKAWCARYSSAPSAPRSPAWSSARRSRRWARSWWRRCSPSACCCWSPPGPR